MVVWKENMDTYGIRCHEERVRQEMHETQQKEHKVDVIEVVFQVDALPMFLQPRAANFHIFDTDHGDWKILFFDYRSCLILPQKVSFNLSVKFKTRYF